jgi:hypothetical protein
MHAGLLDVLHDAADQHVLTVADASTSTSIGEVEKRSSSTGLSFEHCTASVM